MPKSLSVVNGLGLPLWNATTSKDEIHSTQYDRFGSYSFLLIYRYITGEMMPYRNSPKRKKKWASLGADLRRPYPC